MDVLNGVVGTPYNLPFSPPSVTFGDSPTIVLGESGVAFASGHTTTTDGNHTPVDQIASFNVASGAVNWTYQAASGTTLSIVGATNDGGVTITDGSNVDQLDDTGTVSLLGTQMTGIGNSWTGDWYGAAAGGTSQFELPPIQWAVSYAAMVGGNPSRTAEFIGVAAPVEGIPVFGLKKYGPNCILGTSKVALGGDALTHYNTDKQALLNSGSLTSSSCSTFFNADPTRATYLNKLTSGVINQVPYDGAQSNISQYDAGFSDGKNPTDVSIKKVVPVCGLFVTFHGPHGSVKPTGRTTAASQIATPHGGSATDTYITTDSGTLANLTQGTILHETLHNLTGLYDFMSAKERQDFGYIAPYDLKTLLGLETTPGVDPDPTHSTIDITKTLVNNGCAASN